MQSLVRHPVALALLANALATGAILFVLITVLGPISGAHMVERYRQLVPHADTVLLANIGHYPQIEAPVQVLKHYLAFRERIAGPVRELAYLR